jgi:acetyl esterase/lipase
MKITTRLIAILAFFLSVQAISAQNYKTIKDISYVESGEKDAYKLERCKLDIYYPTDVKDFATLVWFHGGGLEGGNKELLQAFKEQGFAVVSVNYRLFPKAKCPDYITDAAQAVAWTFKNIAAYGGTPEQIYVSGHSAGGYLTLMVALAKEYMDAYGVDADKIVKAYPISGQTTTHYTIRKERGIDTTLPIIDKFAPSNNARKEGAPLMLIVGDADLEMMARYEENAHLQAILKHYGHPSELFELEGTTHTSVLGPAAVMVARDVKAQYKNYQKRKTALSPPIAKNYELSRVIQVAGRQGVAADENYYYISSSTALYKYDKKGNLVSSNEDPFKGLALPANHFGDIDVYNGEIYTGIETFMDGVGQNIQVAVYDANTLKFKYSIPWKKESGQVEVCGLAVDREHGRVWMADWVQGHELYCYDIASREYVGKVQLRPAPRLQQGICCLDGKMLISCDDGDAEYDEPDNLYICDLYPSKKQLKGTKLQECGLPATVDVSLFRKMADFKRAGEIEGLTIDPYTDELIVLANRGARIILGMPRGFYSGYTEEIHEIFIYSPKDR